MWLAYLSMIAGGLIASFIGNSFSVFLCAVLFGAIIGPVCWFFYQSGVYVEPTGLKCRPVSGSTKVYPWDTVDRLEMRPILGRSGEHLGVVLKRKGFVELPSCRWWAFEHAEAERVLKELQEQTAGYIGAAVAHADRI